RKGRMGRSGMVLGLLVLSALAGAAAVGRGQDAAAAADPARGAVVFKLCSQCHGPAALGNPEIGAPAISGLPAWYIQNQLHSFRAGARGKHPDDHEGLRMRPMTFVLDGERDIASVSAYVESLPDRKPAATLAGGNAARGAQLYAVCASCHGPDG